MKEQLQISHDLSYRWKSKLMSRTIAAINTKILEAYTFAKDLKFLAMASIAHKKTKPAKVKILR